MGRVIALWAPAKLTLGLRITGTREDGFHLIDAEMVTLDLADRLELEEPDPERQRPDGAPTVEMVDGGVSPGGDEDLIVRALELAGRRARVRLDKNIPPGAGLGGGSADAAAILRWTGLTDLDEAASVGADVPFCLVGGRARVTGIGERVEPLPFVSATYTLLTPPFGCSTPAVYALWDELGGPTGESGNDLEPAALALEPELARYRDRLGDATGSTPRLAGSGSSWFVEGAHPGDDQVVVRTTPAGWAGG